VSWAQDYYASRAGGSGSFGPGGDTGGPAGSTGGGPGRDPRDGSGAGGPFSVDSGYAGFGLPRVSRAASPRLEEATSVGSLVNGGVFGGLYSGGGPGGGYGAGGMDEAPLSFVSGTRAHLPTAPSPATAVAPLASDSTTCVLDALRLEVKRERGLPEVRCFFTHHSHEKRKQSPNTGARANNTLHK